MFRGHPEAVSGFCREIAVEDAFDCVLCKLAMDEPPAVEFVGCDRQQPGGSFAFDGPQGGEPDVVRIVSEPELADGSIEFSVGGTK